MRSSILISLTSIYFGEFGYNGVRSMILASLISVTQLSTHCFVFSSVALLCGGQFLNAAIVMFVHARKRYVVHMCIQSTTTTIYIKYIYAHLMIIKSLLQLCTAQAMLVDHINSLCVRV